MEQARKLFLPEQPITNGNSNDTLEHGLPPYLQASLDKMKESRERLNRGEEDCRWDCYYCELQSNINIAELSGQITEKHAWYLREKFLWIGRPEDNPIQ